MATHSAPSSPGRSSFPTVVDAFVDAVRNAPDREAITADSCSLTYREFGACVAALGKEMRVGRGDRVAVAMPNRPSLPVTILAVLATGAQVALLNPAYPEPALAPLLRDAEPTLVIGDDNDALARLATRHGRAYLSVTAAELAGWSDGDPLLPSPSPRPDDLATLMFTGGTTGVSKGVEHSHANLMATVEGMEASWPTRLDEETWLNVAPLFHIWGILMGCLNPIFGRARLVLVERYEPVQVARLLAQERVTVLSGGPAAIYGGLLGAADLAGLDLSALRICPGGGAPFSEELLRRWEATTGVPIYEAFGMSELAPISVNPFNGVRKPGSVGLPCADVAIEIVDVADGRQPLPAGQVGEIRCRSGRTMLGYRNRPDETARTLIDGWLYTGDIGRKDDDGYLYIVDRKKDMVLVGGYNVYPREIDEILCNHPAVAESVTVGAPDERRGETPVAFVAPVGDSTIDPEELIEHCRRYLVGYKVPSDIRVVSALPKTPAQKADRKVLRSMLAADTLPRSVEPA